jgi:hypothetical protein
MNEEEDVELIHPLDRFLAKPEADDMQKTTNNEERWNYDASLIKLWKTKFQIEVSYIIFLLFLVWLDLICSMQEVERQAAESWQQDFNQAI